MITVLEIEKAVEQLPPDDFTKFHQWLEDYALERALSSSNRRNFAMLDEEDGGESQLIEE